MDTRMRRYAPQASPDRTKVWAEPPPKQHHPPEYQHGAKVPVVYYLCRNRHLEHPHFIEVPLSSPEGLYLRDVVDRLNVLRGKGMAATYSWSCKRSYKNGFVWHDLCEDDLILPAQGNEYVLKGSELVDQTPPDRNNQGASNLKLQNLKHLSQDPPPQPLISKGQEASCSSSSMGIVIKESKLPPLSPIRPARSAPPMQEDELSPSTRRSDSSGNFSPEAGGRSTPPSMMSSPNPTEYKIHNPIGSQDASTQTDVEGGRSTRGLNPRIGVSTVDASPSVECNGTQNEQKVYLKEEPEIVKVENSPPSTIPGDSSSRGKINTLESLIRDEVNRRNNHRALEAEEVFLPTGPKFKATNLLMHLITCGSTTVKDRYGFGLVPTYRPRFTDMNFTSPLSANSIILGEINYLPESQRETGARPNKKENVNGSMIETSKYKEEIGEGLPSLKQTSPFDEDRSCNKPCSRKDTQKETSSAQLKCPPRTIKITSCKHSRNDENESMMSPVSDIRNSSVKPDTCKSSPLSSSNGGSKRIIDASSANGSSMRLESFRENREKVFKIEERLTSGARVIIQSRCRSDDSEGGSD